MSEEYKKKTKGDPEYEKKRTDRREKKRLEREAKKKQKEEEDSKKKKSESENAEGKAKELKQDVGLNLGENPLNNQNNNLKDELHYIDSKGREGEEDTAQEKDENADGENDKKDDEQQENELRKQILSIEGPKFEDPLPPLNPGEKPIAKEVLHHITRDDLVRSI